MPIQVIAIGAQIYGRIAGFRRLRRRLGRAVVEVVRNMFDPYRPELHYMRGPGPKWRAVHVRVRRDD